MTILDDGSGMSEERLVEAMRFGGLGPMAQRASTDLGRFGLGLKTASLSQCRQLTVASKTTEDGQLLISVSDMGIGLSPDEAERIKHRRVECD